jgi:YHS domain-containing protein
MFITAIAALTLGFAGPQPPLHCVTTLEDITGEPAVKLEYGGAVFGTCCGGCDAPFMKDPKTLIAKAVKANKTIGTFRYDAVTGAKIDGAKAPAFSDYKAIRYFFASTDEKKAFDAKPASYVTEVKSEAYFCPVMKHDTKSENAGGFADYNGTRYYLCCGDCVAAFKKDPAKFAANAAAATKPLSALTVKK